MWMCRQADLIEYFLSHVDFSVNAWTIVYYTGKRALVLPEKIFTRNPMLKVIQGRPDLERDILGLMSAIEENTTLPEIIMNKASETYASMFLAGDDKKVHALIDRALARYSMVELFRIAVDCSILAKEAHDDDINPHSTYITHKGFARFMAFISEDLEVVALPCLVALLGQVDTNRSGRIDTNGFSQALFILKGHSAVHTERGAANWKVLRQSSELSSPISPGRATISEGHIASQPTFSDWQVLYCGGVVPVTQTLAAMRKKYGFSLKIESFDW